MDQPPVLPDAPPIIGEQQRFVSIDLPSARYRANMPAAEAEVAASPAPRSVYHDMATPPRVEAEEPPTGTVAERVRTLERKAMRHIARVDAREKWQDETKALEMESRIRQLEAMIEHVKGIVGGDRSDPFKPKVPMVQRRGLDGVPKLSGVAAEFADWIFQFKAFVRCEPGFEKFVVQLEGLNKEPVKGADGVDGWEKFLKGLQWDNDIVGVDPVARRTALLSVD